MRLTYSLKCFYDDVDMYMALSSWLESAGYDVSGAAGLEGTDTASAEDQPDLFIIIRRAADGSSASLCRRVREATPKTPIIVWSGSTSEEDLRAALASGANAYMAATFSLTDLTETVARLLRAAVRDNKC
jgi:DNA-binding response OmpR family regulator